MNHFPFLNPKITDYGKGGFSNLAKFIFFLSETISSCILYVMSNQMAGS